jgi:hypothetical protein
MRFTPRSASDIDAEQKVQAAKFAPWPSGVYDFEVMSAEDAVSRAGNDMIALELAVFNKSGERRTIRDWLMEAIAYKLRHAAEACGVVKLYDKGTLDAVDFVGKTGKLKLGVQPGQDGYGPKNTVKDYVSDEADGRAEVRAQERQVTRSRPAAGPAPSDLDDEIPF